MHELTICKNIVDILLGELARTNHPIVTAIHLEIGQFTLIEKSSLIFCFEVVVKDTPLENAKLVIKDISARGLCETCQDVIVMKQRFDGCQKCGATPLKIIQGEELLIKAMEIQ